MAVISNLVKETEAFVVTIVTSKLNVLSRSKFLTDLKYEQLYREPNIMAFSQCYSKAHSLYLNSNQSQFQTLLVM